MDNNIREDNSQSMSDDARNQKMSELEILRQSLNEKKQLAEDYYNQLLRLKAEFENYRKRIEKEKQNYLNWGKEEILLKQLKILDVLEQARSFTNSSNNVESLKKGVELMYQEFIKLIKEEGILEIKDIGEKFNPNLHEAVEQVESDEPEGTILEVIQKGYALKDRIIRHSKVKVAASTKKNS